MTVLAPARERFRWTILALISVSHIIGASAQYGINTLAPFYKDELGLSRAQVGLFFSAFYLAMTGASFATGWLADRFGVRRTTWQGHFLLGICIVARGTVAIILDRLHQFLSRRLRLQLSQSRFDHRCDGLVSARRARHRDGYQTNRSSGRRSGRGGFSAFARARDRLARRAGRARDRQFSF